MTTLLFILTLASLVICLILIILKIIYRRRAHDAIRYCKYQRWEYGEKSKMGIVFLKRADFVHCEMRRYARHHNKRIKRLRLIFKHVVNDWKKDLKRNQDVDFFERVVVFTLKEVKDNFKKPHISIRALSFCWRRLSNEKKEKFFKANKRSKK